MSRRCNLHTRLTSEEQPGVNSSRFPPPPAYHEILERFPYQWRRLRPTNGLDICRSDRIVFVRYLDCASNKHHLPECDERLDANTARTRSASDVWPWQHRADRLLGHHVLALDRSSDGTAFFQAASSYEEGTINRAKISKHKRHDAQNKCRTRAEHEDVDDAGLPKTTPSRNPSKFVQPLFQEPSDIIAANT